MELFAGILGQLVEALGTLPGIGPKTAQRLAFHLLRRDPEAVARLARVMVEARQRVHPCPECFALTETDPCPICRDPNRATGELCVVAEPRDVLALERSGVFRGHYHVLNGVLSPLEGIGPETLNIQALVDRVRRGGVREVILALNHDVEGEATALYLHRLLKPLEVRMTRLASGLPAGGDLEYADDATLGHALGDRRELI